MFNSTLITLENSLLNPHTGGLPVTQKKRKKVNNKIYFLCISGSMTVGLLCKPTSKIVGSVVVRGLGTYGLPITSHCYGRHHGYLKKGKGAPFSQITMLGWAYQLRLIVVFSSSCICFTVFSTS